MKSHLVFSIQIIALWAVTGTFSFKNFENRPITGFDKTSTMGHIESNDPIKFPNQKQQTAKLSFTPDTDLIFQLCYHQCGDPRLAINQACFRSCWWRLSKRIP